ncbi:unnamed protein product [Gongylonema pulchrum]|uniref:PTB domain-containing protein n=1 Tax=Gongylonema pulchrum TaxID=637853 RepID=A0A183EU18_9BILA|nr:unnamed protein product [Gongylonema pulchrum]
MHYSTYKAIPSWAPIPTENKRGAAEAEQKIKASITKVVHRDELQATSLCRLTVQSGIHVFDVELVEELALFRSTVSVFNVEEPRPFLHHCMERNGMQVQNTVVNDRKTLPWLNQGEEWSVHSFFL